MPKINEPRTFGFEYEVKMDVCLPLNWVEFMIEVAEHHYDYKCRALAKQGGKLYGLRNVATWNEEDDFKETGGPTSMSVSSHDIDTMMKAMEQHYYLVTVKPADDHEKFYKMGRDIIAWLHEIFDKITARWKICHDLPS